MPAASPETATRDTAYRFETFRLDRRDGLFRLGENGERNPVVLGSRATDLLTLLVERRGELVSRRDLMDAAWPGVAVEDSNLVVQISTLRRVLDDGRAGASCIQTIVGRGYRFLPEVMVEPAAPPPEAFAPVPETVEPPSDKGVAAEPPPDGRSPPKPGDPGLFRRIRPRWRLVLLATCLAVIAGAGGVASRWIWNGDPPQIAAPRLSIVVLPFQNLSGDPKDDYLADAITDDLTTDLSHIPQAFVIANTSARTYRGRSHDAREIGKELGTRYLLEGSVRRMDQVLRVNAQLISTETGAHLWADRFDQDIADLASGQELVLARMRGALGIGLVEIEASRGRRERPANPDAFDLILRARWTTNQPRSPRRDQEARALFEQALRLDPTSVAAMTGLANVLSGQSMNWAGQWLSGEDQAQAAALVKSALTRAPESEAALAAHVRLLHGQTRMGELLTPSSRLVELYPNNPDGYHHLARAKQTLGQYEEAIALFKTAIQRDPRDPQMFQRYGFMAFTMMQAGHYAESAHWFARSLAANPDAPAPLRAARYRNMGASLAFDGRLTEAREAVREADRLWPFQTVRSHYPLDLASPALVAHEITFRRGLALAGLRDHADENADFGVAPDNELHANLAGYTPTVAPGVVTIRTDELRVRLEGPVRTIVLDTVTHFWGRSIPGAIGLKQAGSGGSFGDGLQARLRDKMAALTGNDLSAPIVVVGWNVERFDGRNLALRLAALGYTNVFWYRGGREAWEVAELPETDLIPRDW